MQKWTVLATIDAMELLKSCSSPCAPAKKSNTIWCWIFLIWAQGLKVKYNIPIDFGYIVIAIEKR